MTYDIACLSFLAQCALATDTWGSQAVTQQSRAVPELYYTVPVREIQVVCLPGLLHGASDGYWCASCRSSSVSALNRSYDCPPFGTINLHARARAKSLVLMQSQHVLAIKTYKEKSCSSSLPHARSSSSSLCPWGGGATGPESSEMYQEQNYVILNIVYDIVRPISYTISDINKS